MEDRISARLAEGASLPEQLEAVLADLAARDGLTEQSLRRVGEITRRFGRFAVAGLGAVSLAELGCEDARRFIEADAAAGRVSTSTMHLRRTVLRLVFRSGRRLGLVDGDPTLDLRLPAKTSLRARPLEDEEVALCRSASLHTLTGTRLAAAWALTEATARTAELPRLTVADLDLDGQRVWIHGGSRVTPRWGELSSWGATQLERHVRSLPTADPDQRLVYRGKGSAESHQASACIVIAEVLARAGLGDEPDVRPLSAVAWAGRRILEETGRIEQVACRLGMRSLDRTAELIGLDWADQ